MNFGAHVSTSGGLPNACINAESLGVKSFQIFPWSPRMWNPGSFNPDTISDYKKLYEEKGMEQAVIHMIYLANLASADDFLYERSTAALLATTDIAEAIGAYGVVLHLGSNKDKNQGIERLAGAVRKATQKLKDNKVRILLENSAGGGNLLGNNFKEIAEIITASGSDERVGVCIDTCHSFAAGYDWVNEADKVFDDIKNSFGFSRVCAFHMNDSMFQLGKGRDRHENIGEGHIGLAGFTNIVSRPEFAGLPALLETPGFDGNGPDLKNLEILRKLIK